MRLYFKPMPWLTVFSILGLILLLKLGFWQKDRLAWKTDLLARIEAAAEAPPFSSLQEVVDALESDAPVDFRRYAMTAETVPGPAYYVYDPTQGNISWRIFGKTTNQGQQVYLAKPSIDDELKGLLEAVVTSAETFQSAGYVRLADEPPSGFGKWIKSQPSPDTNRWFAFNQNDLWADKNTRMDIWLDEYKAEIDTELPPLRPDIPNNHRDYMLTWFSFAGLLIIFYLMIHRRAGRLGRRDT